MQRRDRFFLMLALTVVTAPVFAGNYPYYSITNTGEADRWWAFTQSEQSESFVAQDGTKLWWKLTEKDGTVSVVVSSRDATISEHSFARDTRFSYVLKEYGVKFQYQGVASTRAAAPPATPARDLRLAAPSARSTDPTITGIERSSPPRPTATAPTTASKEIPQWYRMERRDGLAPLYYPTDPYRSTSGTPKLSPNSNYSAYQAGQAEVYESREFWYSGSSALRSDGPRSPYRVPPATNWPQSKNR